LILPPTLDFHLPDHVINTAIMWFLQCNDFGSVYCWWVFSSFVLRKFTSFAYRTRSQISWGNEAINWKTWYIECNLFNRPGLFHFCFSMAHGHLPKPEKGYHGMPRVSNHYTFHRLVITEEWIDCGLPINCITPIRLDARQMRVLNVNKKTSLLAKVAKQYMPYNLGRTLTPSLQCFRVSTKLQDEAILTIDVFLSYASGISKHTCSGSRINTLIKQIYTLRN